MAEPPRARPRCRRSDSLPASGPARLPAPSPRPRRRGRPPPLSHWPARRGPASRPPLLGGAAASRRSAAARAAVPVDVKG